MTPWAWPWPAGGPLSDDALKRIEALAERAQVACEARLERAYYELHEDPDEYDGDGSEPFAPFCGCLTCVVREVLDASYPYMREAARIELST